MNKFSSVYELLEDPKRWTKNRNARLENFSPCKFDDSNAVCWCVYGAIKKVYKEKYLDVHVKLDKIIQLKYPDFTEMIGFNDDPNTTHQMILEVIREAGI